MGKIRPCDIHPPCQKSIPINIPRDWDVLNVFFDENNNNMTVLFRDGTIGIVNLKMLISYEDIITSRKYQNAVRNQTAIAKTEEKIEKLFTQPKELFEAVDFSEFDIVEASEPHTPKFIEGENYALQGVACDGFEMETKIYKLIKVVDDFYGTNINSVIVKQIAGEQGIIFTLSKNDCEYHGIEYEKGLQLFPKTLNWVRVKDKIPFDKNNLATTPVSDVDNTVRFILLRLDGFKDYLDGYILTPSGHLIGEKHFMDTLRITTKEPIVYGNGYVINDKTNLDIQLVYPKNLVFNHANFISSEDTIFVMIKLKREYISLVNSEFISIDGCFGVEPKYLDGLCPNEFFEISWDELGAYTVEEYEALKAERARIEAARIKKAEEERKRKILEEEKRIKEQRKRAENAVNRMRGYRMKLPTFPHMPNIEFNGSIGSIDMIVNSLDTYFDNLTNSLTILNEDLNTMAKLGGADIASAIKNRAIRNSDSQFGRLLKLLY